MLAVLWFVQDLAVWFALAAVAVVLGAVWSFVTPTWRARAARHRALDDLGPCAPEDSWIAGQELTVGGELVARAGEEAAVSRRNRRGDVREEDSAEGLALRTAEGTVVRLRAPLAVRVGSRIEERCDLVAHSLAGGDRVRLRGRLQIAAGGEAGFRDSAHAWELTSLRGRWPIDAVAEGRPSVRRGGWAVARGALAALILYAMCTAAASAGAQHDLVHGKHSDCSIR